jgi:RNA polymerase sigma-70 factor, ECF subfamily
MPQRNAERFALSIEPWLDKLFKSAYRLTQNRADAEELVQETCIRAFTKRRLWSQARSPLGWLMRVQYNLFVDGARHEARRRIVPFETDDPGVTADARFDPESRVDEEQRMAHVQRAWRKLNEGQRALLALRVEGYTLAEIKDITGLSIDVINARLHRARQSLARHLKQDDAAAGSRQRLEVRR